MINPHSYVLLLIQFATIIFQFTLWHDILGYTMTWYLTLAVTKISIFVVTRSVVPDLRDTPIISELLHQSVRSSVTWGLNTLRGWYCHVIVNVDFLYLPEYSGDMWTTLGFKLALLYLIHMLLYISLYMTLISCFALILHV